MEIVEYNSSLSIIWDEFVDSSKNGTFMHKRSYISYHKDRFVDMSFMISNKGKIRALLPGNIEGKTFYSHKGLTYGGFVMAKDVTIEELLEAMSLVVSDLKKQNVSHFVYKSIPYIYTKYPSQEDLYILFRYNGTLESCYISSTVQVKTRLKFTESRKSGVRKGRNNKLSILENTDYHKFWSLLNSHLQDKYQTEPLHTPDDLIYLANNHKDNIRLFLVYHNTTLCAGTLLYCMHNLVHVQYICSNEEGRGVGALDFLFDFLIESVFFDVEYFDFGHSNGDNGRYLNNSLVFQKQGFGGRGVVYQTFKLSL